MPQADLTRLATKLRHRVLSSGLLDKDQKERKVSSKMCKRERDRRCVTDKVYSSKVAVNNSPSINARQYPINSSNSR
ncbi:hypothetical protein C0Q70_09737 [Pomacea canaliculata]|uniref:Uncharacterized protein n=1 Tax=Pomacea canaliculata TaxID=400727 RepID=A0A2T7PAN2_POMCA|nr:hypothetical protein C0Q70_09737 [Pomacea canaliculata]